MPQIEIAVDNPALLFALFEAKTVSTNMTREIPGGATLTYGPSGYIERRGSGTFDAATVVTLVVAFGSNVAAGALGCWLYEKLTSKPTRKITIDRKQVELTRDGLARVITERIALK